MNNTSKGGSRLPMTELPKDLREDLGRFYDLPLTSKSALEALITEYADDIEQAANSRGDLDVNLADCISRSCMTLLNEEWDRAEESGKRLIQAACHYFVENDDQDGDLESVYGFDDDAEIVNAILELLNRQDLMIQI
jgi:hypothetical protein